MQSIVRKIQKTKLRSTTDSKDYIWESVQTNFAPQSQVHNGLLSTLHQTTGFYLQKNPPIIVSAVLP